MRKYILAAVAVLLGLAQQYANPFKTSQYNFVYDMTHRDRIDMIVMGEYMSSLSYYWKDEVSRRYSDAVMILAHGGPSYMDQEWACVDQLTGKMRPWSEVVDEIRKRHPYRRIVIISCNPFHQHLDREYVSYARQDVWFFPDRIMLEPLGEIFGEERYVGDIFDFIEQ